MAKLTVASVSASPPRYFFKEICVLVRSFLGDSRVTIGLTREYRFVMPGRRVCTASQLVKWLVGEKEGSRFAPDLKLSVSFGVATARSSRPRSTLSAHEAQVSTGPRAGELCVRMAVSFLPEPESVRLSNHRNPFIDRRSYLPDHHWSKEKIESASIGITLSFKRNPFFHSLPRYFKKALKYFFFPKSILRFILLVLC